MNAFRKIMFLSLLAPTFGVQASDHVITQYSLVGPYAVSRPVMLDSVNVMGVAFSDESLLELPLVGTANATTATNGQSLSAIGDYSVAQLSFDVDVTSYTKATLNVTGLHDKKTYLDGKASDCNDVVLEPGSHTFTVKALLRKGKGVKPRLTLTSDDNAVEVMTPGTSHLYNIKDVLNGPRYTAARISNSGRYGIVGYVDTQTGGKTVRKWDVRDLATGNIVRNYAHTLQFYPGTDDLLYARADADGKRQLIRAEIATGKETVIAGNLPDDSWQMTPDGRYLVLSHYNEGPKEDKEIYQIVEPADRQPGWRNRTSLSLYDMTTGSVQPLTFGFHDVSLLDISRDSRYILFMTSRSRLTERPTTVMSLWRMDLRTLETECLVKDDGFLSSARLSPDGKTVAIMGSPECLGGVGVNVPEGRIPSVYDYQLFTMDIATKEVKAITKEFAPGINDYAWAADGELWITALDRDYCHLYRYNPSADRFVQVEEPEDMVSRFSLSTGSKKMLWHGQGASNSDRLYVLDTTTGRSTLVEDLSAKKLKDVTLGKCEAWSFLNSRGDSISCRYYLPPKFDATKSYPMIVNYYGGCSPTSRDFETRYPQHVYAAAGYVVLIVNPSGAVGWGQEFSSRHVNTAGKGVADDIIEATKNFYREHQWVDSLHVGCIGASYGGFMTQYLQTQTDIFAAAISHAGISDHTSYWGEGYWGYSYSEVSMAKSYPWTRKDLYVDQSPLFNAEKIHTPLLFLHGNSDHNVPIGESIQMFTALKLLGRPTAFVAVDGEDHHILDYGKRVKWHNTIMAWFQRYLKGDASWWNAIYKKVQE